MTDLKLKVGDSLTLTLTLTLTLNHSLHAIPRNLLKSIWHHNPNANPDYILTQTLTLNVTLT